MRNGSLQSHNTGVNGMTVIEKEKPRNTRNFIWSLGNLEKYQQQFDVVCMYVYGIDIVLMLFLIG